MSLLSVCCHLRTDKTAMTAKMVWLLPLMLGLLLRCDAQSLSPTSSDTDPDNDVTASQSPLTILDNIVSSQSPVGDIYDVIASSQSPVEIIDDLIASSQSPVEAIDDVIASSQAPSDINMPDDAAMGFTSDGQGLDSDPGSLPTTTPQDELGGSPMTPQKTLDGVEVAFTSVSVIAITTATNAASSTSAEGQNTGVDAASTEEVTPSQKAVTSGVDDVTGVSDVKLDVTTNTVATNLETTDSPERKSSMGVAAGAITPSRTPLTQTTTQAPLRQTTTQIHTFTVTIDIPEEEEAVEEEEMEEGISTEEPTTKTTDVYDIEVKLTFSGNCTVLKGNPAAGMTFKDSLRSALVGELNTVTLREVSVGDITCGSVKVTLVIQNVAFPDEVEEELDSVLSANNTDFLNIHLDVANETYVYTAVDFSVETNAVGGAAVTPPTGTAPPGGRPPTKKEQLPLTEIQIIVIIVCCVAGGTLMIFAFIFCIYACHQRRRTKTFELGETPVSQVSMEDFTLTKLQRPSPLYKDNGVVIRVEPNRDVALHQQQHAQPPDQPHDVTSRHDPNQLDSHADKDANYHYQPYNANPNPQPVDGNPSNVNSSDSPRKGSPEHLDPSAYRIVNGGHLDNDKRVTQPRSGYDNPSFSSDDILDSGPDTDTELPLDPLPVRAPTPGQSAQGGGLSPAHGSREEGATAF